jgi:hypothetical protein
MLLWLPGRSRILLGVASCFLLMLALWLSPVLYGCHDVRTMHTSMARRLRGVPAWGVIAFYDDTGGVQHVVTCN